MSVNLCSFPRTAKAGALMSAIPSFNSGSSSLGTEACKNMRRLCVLNRHLHMSVASASGSASGSVSGSVVDALKFPFSRPSGWQPPVEFARLRREAPVSKVQLWDGSWCWLLTRHADLTSLLSDPRFSKVRTTSGFPELSAGGRQAAFAANPTFVDMDPPAHTKQRNMVKHVFTTLHSAKLQPSIQQTVDDLIVKLKNIPKSQHPVDLIQHFALPLPTRTIYRILGIPEKDEEFLATQNAVRTNGSSTSGQAALAAKELTNYLTQLVNYKQQQIGHGRSASSGSGHSDLISDLLIRNVSSGELSKEDCVQVIFLLLVAGNATLVNAIALGVATLLHHPDQLRALRADWRLSRSAIEEILRYHTGSALAIRRVALEDVTVGGQRIAKGEGVIASNQSANRDELVFSNPDQFDIFRAPNPHVAFGSGTHMCIAEWLCRAEMECVFGAKGIFAQLPQLKLAVPLEKLEFSPPAADVGIIKLPVSF